MFEPTDLAWHNGRLVPRESAAPSIASHSLHLGIGVFDGLMAYWNRDRHYLHRVTDHIDRFRHGADRLDLTVRWDTDTLIAGIRELLAAGPAVDLYIRPIAYRALPEIRVTNGAQLPADVAIFGVRVPRDLDRPIRYQISPVERVSSAAIPVAWKVCGSYVNSYLARRAAEAAGVDDGLFLDRSGRVVEASAANIFFWSGGRLITPALTGDVFPGITRQVILEIAAGIGVAVTEREVFPAELPGFDGAFVCSTLMEVRPVSEIDAHQFGDAADGLTQQIVTAFRAITHRG